MRIFLFILGVFAAVSALRNPLRPKIMRGVPMKILQAAPRIAGFQRFNNAWPP
jgi:hypothetical protein